MIKEVKMYTIICDNCGKDLCDGTEYSCWNDEDYVKDSARESDWHITEDDKHYCDDCYSWGDEDELILKPIIK
jgi:hypothetical protein